LLGGARLFAGATDGTPATLPSTTQPAQQLVPRRAFGKTGVQVPILALGGIFNIPENQLVLKQAMRWGVRYWDTANSYLGGKSERGIGMYFEKYPQDRKKIFLVTKAKSKRRDAEWLSQQLTQSLERLKTDYVDLFFSHSVSDPRDVRKYADEWKSWSQDAKKRGRIRFFGFSTHKNMAECLLAASKLGFIDGIMLKYDFRIMGNDDMKRAVEACAKAGIGLTAMKTQAGRSRPSSGDLEAKLLKRFIKKGFTDKQAKLKAVWTNPNIASICSAMYTTTVLASNVAAAMDKTTLSSAELRLLDRYAAATCSGYCAGCGNICESAVPGNPPISDVMRALMYLNDYGDARKARSTFRQVPARVRRRLAALDYAAAEARCPQRMPIASLMREATKLLA